MKPPGWMKVTIPRCEPLAGDRQLAWCIGHDASWPTRDPRCRMARDAARQGRIIVKAKARLWHPGWWAVVLGELLRRRRAKP